MQRNHPQRRCLTKGERNLFNRSAEKYISRESRRQNTALPNKCHHITIHESYQRNNEANTPTIGLHCIARGISNHILQQRYETVSPQQCKLTQRTKGKNPNRRSLLFIQRSNDTTKQRRNSQHCTHHQTRHDIRNRSQTSGTIHHDTKISILQNHIR